MRNKIFGSIVLAGLTLGSVQAVDVNAFGHIGGIYDQGLSRGNIPAGSTKKGAFAGVTGHLGVDIGAGAVHFGVGAYSGASLYKTSGMPNRYTNNYIDVSDLYFKYDTGMLQIAIGRFDNEFLDSDWLTAHSQGVGFKYQSRSIGVWATWMNDFATYGYAPGRIGSELASWNRFPSSFNHFSVGNRDIIAGGINFDFGFLSVDPFVHYYRYPYDGKIQAGAKLALKFGQEGSAFQSITSLRSMWQNIMGIDNDNAMLFWGDQEFVFGNVFKIGGGYYATTRGGISTPNNVTRFYGGTYLTPGYYYNNTDGYYGNDGYFGAKMNTWYVFTGIKSDWVDVDVLYADGNYREFSAILSVNVFDTKVNGSLNGISLKIGGGYVNNGFGTSPKQDNVVVFAKLSF